MANFDDAEFRRRCLKPDPQRLGTWTARRIGRPVALRITRIAAPCGASAHQATAAAACAALGAVAAFGFGSSPAWAVGVGLLAVWYVLDHVDGQLARWHGTASLDGTTLDYLMHHGVSVLLPAAVGFGLARHRGELGWCIAGIVWSWGGSLASCRHDARYKAFFQRLKLVHGELRAIGGGGGRPQPATVPQRRPLALARWLVQKLFEQHVVAASLGLVMLLRLTAGDFGEAAALGYLAVMGALAPLNLLPAVRAARRGEAEREFAAWFRLPPGDSLELRDGWWFVEPDVNVAADAGMSADSPTMS